MKQRGAILMVVVMACLTACGPAPSTPSAAPTPTPSATPDLSTRPASPVTVRIVSPVNGAVIHGTTVHVEVAITGGTVVQQTSTDADPTRGHVHVYLQNQLILMSYTLIQDVPVKPGITYVMHAEWVGADHFPFNPRDVTPDLFFSVAPG